MSHPGSESGEFYSFDAEMVNNAHAAAKRRYERADLSTTGFDETQSTLSITGGCIGIIVKNNQACLHIPVVNKDVCIPLPVHIKDGTVAEACLNICYKFGVPSGVCVEVKVLGRKVAGECWGLC